MWYAKQERRVAPGGKISRGGPSTLVWGRGNRRSALMELRHIRHFIAVAETESFTKFSTHIGVPAGLICQGCQVGSRVSGQAARASYITGRSDGRRVPSPGTLASPPVCRLVKSVSHMHPGASFALCDGTKNSLLSRLADHKLDAVVGRIDGSDSRFNFSILFKERFVSSPDRRHTVRVFAPYIGLGYDERHG